MRQLIILNTHTDMHAYVEWGFNLDANYSLNKFMFFLKILQQIFPPYALSIFNFLHHHHHPRCHRRRQGWMKKLLNKEKHQRKKCNKINNFSEMQ